MKARGGDRGQINFDFAVGVSILVVTIIIAFSFVPSIFGGVTEGRQQSDKVVADRVAEWAVTEGLADPANPGELDIHCVNSFFSPSSALTYCGFGGDTIEENLPFDYDRNINITIQYQEDIQCFADGTWRYGVIRHDGDPGCTGPYEAGGSPGGSAEVSTSTRAVTLAGRHLTLIVRVW